MWLIYDVETTGLDIKKDRITEYGKAVYDPKKKAMVACDSRLVYSEGVEPTDTTISLNGITKELLVENSIPHNIFCGLFMPYLLVNKITHIVSHNGTLFDIPMTKEEFKRQDMNFPEAKLIDTHTDVKWRPFVTGRSLGHLASDHGFVNPFPHRALSDCLTLMKILMQYDYAEIEARADSPTIIMQSLQAFPDNADAQKEGFRWNPAEKKWLKTIKEIDLPTLPKYPFQTQVVML